MKQKPKITKDLQSGLYNASITYDGKFYSAEGKTSTEALKKLLKQHEKSFGFG